MITQAVLDTLFFPLQTGALRPIPASARCAFLNAHQHNALEKIPNLSLEQPFKPSYNSLSRTDLCSPLITEDNSFDYVFIALPKNQIESEYLIARGLTLLKAKGTIIAAADNKAGGSRIAKTLKKFGLDNPQSLSKNKAKCVWVDIETLNTSAVKTAIDQGAQTSKNGYCTQPGIYGWNKIDKGSKILINYIPEDLKGKGADFGCGFGYLSKETLNKAQKIKHLTLIEADKRAIECAEFNLKSYTDIISTNWQDITIGTNVKNLDFIIMNPPFHEGKNANPAIGMAFIKSAYDALKKHGYLYMVANIQLPYEDTLNSLFYSTEKLHEGDGFKVYKAMK
tara:strand:+ start:6551 stop:7564 length:1014 start_codon:yes stop_codon:yes gene_type:complete